MATISQFIHNRRSFYVNKLNSYEEWASKKSEMNDTSLKYIRKMLVQMLKELGILSSSILNNIYSNDYDATVLINRVSENRVGVFDMLSKDSDVRCKSAAAALYALNYVKVCTASYNTSQLAGLCIFVQFILICGRSEYEGFGVCTDLISQWKQNERKKKWAENQKFLDEQKRIHEEACQKANALVEEEKKKKEKENKKLEPEKIVDSWEDL